MVEDEVFVVVRKSPARGSTPHKKQVAAFSDYKTAEGVAHSLHCRTGQDHIVEFVSFFTDPVDIDDHPEWWR